MDETPEPTVGKRKSLVTDETGAVQTEEPLSGFGRRQIHAGLDHLVLCEIPNLGNGFESAKCVNVLLPAGDGGSGSAIPYNKLIKEDDCIIYEHVRDVSKPPTARAFIRAGPRKELHFDPKEVNACIVTCGGLAPGLNSIIHHVQQTLENNYAICGKIWGIRGGYNGFHNPATPPILLDDMSSEVPGANGHLYRGLQHQGGSLLGSSRGGFDLEKIMQFISEKSIKCMFVVGGDGTHRGVIRIAQECIKRRMNVAVAGIPKTIDNDIAIIDRSFGFLTAVEEAQPAIRSATTEARCNLPNGIGIVKLMGRSAGFIAAHATLASGDVDLCLVPEVPIVLRGAKGCLPHLERRVAEKGYAVVVVAEGAGEELLGESMETDPSGNKKLPAIGEFMKEQITKYFSEKGKQTSVKYLDPSYTIRSCAANAFDQEYCMQLAQNAVHGCMAGFTAFSTGVVNNRTVMIPIQDLVEASPATMNPRGRTWERVLCITRQPNTVDL